MTAAHFKDRPTCCRADGIRRHPRLLQVYLSLPVAGYPGSLVGADKENGDGRLTNPFEYEAENEPSTNAIIDYYIEDYNYSRFIRSKRNVFLVGERGCGKTMALVITPCQSDIEGPKGQQPVPLGT